MGNVANRVFAAVWAPECPLPAELRAFVACLAQLADWRTGRGLSGQARIAAAMGVTPRQVRRYRVALEALGDASPVRVTWAARGSDAGRTSDAYQLHVGESGHSVRIPGGKADMSGGESGHNVLQSPQGSPEGIPPEGFIKDTTSPIGSPSSRKARRDGRRQLPHAWAPTAAHIALARAFGRDVEDAAASFKAHARTTSRAAADWDAAFELWLRQGPRPALQTAAREQRASARRSASVEAWRAATVDLLEKSPAAAGAVLRVRAAKDRNLARLAARVLRCTLREVVWSPAQVSELMRVGVTATNPTAP